MHTDIVDLKAFYAGRLGTIARRFVGLRIRRHWPNVSGDRILGVGYAVPYLTQFGDEPACRFAFMPAAQGVAHWPPGAPNAAALVLSDALPLPGAAVDRIVAVHSLESVDNVAEHLRELWRVLTPGGRLLAVVPSRAGIWARGERTPFGRGRPFSRGQIEALLREAMFSPIAWSKALAMPPIRSPLLMRSGAYWERVGGVLWPAMSGVLIVEATKLVQQPIQTGKGARSRILRPVLAPPAGMG